MAGPEGPSEVPNAAATDQAARGKDAIAAAFAGYKKSFPEVEDITPAELDALRQSEEAFLLVDVRGADEQQVSMLEGAMRRDDFQHALPEDKDRLIITYCTAGLRSGKYAAELQRLGYRHVKNLQGSLVSWVLEGRPLVGPDGQPVKRFHAYGPQWADMAAGSGYETVVHKAPLLRGVTDTVKSMWPFK